VNDQSKDEIVAIVQEAEKLGGYQDLSPEKQAILIPCLEVDHQKKDTGIV